MVKRGNASPGDRCLFGIDLHEGDARLDPGLTRGQLAAVLGPLASFLERRRVPMVLGFDPLFQVMHEEDAAQAILTAAGAAVVVVVCRTSWVSRSAVWSTKAKPALRTLAPPSRVRVGTRDALSSRLPATNWS